jgi:hypothetical protein
MNKAEYEAKREILVKRRKELMAILDSQEDFPDKNTRILYEDNKREIIHLDIEFLQKTI